MSHAEGSLDARVKRTGSTRSAGTRCSRRRRLGSCQLCAFARTAPRLTDVELVLQVPDTDGGELRAHEAEEPVHTCGGTRAADPHGQAVDLGLVDPGHHSPCASKRGIVEEQERDGHSSPLRTVSNECTRHRIGKRPTCCGAVARSATAMATMIYANPCNPRPDSMRKRRPALSMIQKAIAVEMQYVVAFTPVRTRDISALMPRLFCRMMLK